MNGILLSSNCTEKRYWPQLHTELVLTRVKFSIFSLTPKLMIIMEYALFALWITVMLLSFAKVIYAHRSLRKWRKLTE